MSPHTALGPMGASAQSAAPSSSDPVVLPDDKRLAWIKERDEAATLALQQLHRYTYVNVWFVRHTIHSHVTFRLVVRLGLHTHLFCFVHTHTRTRLLCLQPYLVARLHRPSHELQTAHGANLRRRPWDWGGPVGLQVCHTSSGTPHYRRSV